jgi:hypothetical protein
MSTLDERKPDPQERASRKRQPARRKSFVAEATRIAEQIEALNVQLEALIRRGAR